jgi:phosphoglucosamine mutase
VTRDQRIFGTDGVRDKFGHGFLTPGSIARLLRATTAVLEHRGDFSRDFPGEKSSAERCRVIVGRDTRASGEDIGGVVALTLKNHAYHVVDVGVVPTPGVAYLLSTKPDSALGIVISASHNPAEYNGIKFFAPTGAKVSPEFEDAVSSAYWSESAGAMRDGGTPESDPGAVDAYVDYLVAACRNPDALKGRRVALDTAHGATHDVAPRVFRALGAEVSTLGDQPNGENINAVCGALYPENLAKEVVARNAVYGFCFDGDGDRMIPVTESGDVLDGDITLAITGRHLQSEGRLPLKTVVATVMSNLGLEKSLAECDIELLRTPVGDRHVYESMVAEGHPVGGEQSGHLIFLDDALTGDGTLAALRLVDSLASFDWSLGGASRVMKRYPQILVNYDVARKIALDDTPEVQDVIRLAEKALDGEGRIVLRYSGTEPLLRVMVEGPESGLIERVARQIGESVVQLTE